MTRNQKRLIGSLAWFTLVTLTLLSVVVTLHPLKAPAAEETGADAPLIKIGIPTLSGKGCPPGSAVATLSPDGGEIAILFDKFRAEAGEPTGRPAETTACQLSLPLELPAGTELRVFQVDYRGFNALPDKSRLIITSQHQFSDKNSRGAPRSRAALVASEVKGPRDDDFFASHRLRDHTRSGCQNTPVFEMKTYLRVENFQRGTLKPLPGLAFASLDSIDGRAHGVKFRVALKPCGGTTRGPN